MTIFPPEHLDVFLSKLNEQQNIPAPEGQPIHVVYGGADRFNASTIAKLGELARRSFAENAPHPSSLVDIFGIEEMIVEIVHAQVSRRLELCPVEDYRIDFEDGLGVRSDAEEDAFAENAAVETRVAIEAGGLPPFFGIRIRPLRTSTARRALRTLDIYMTTLLSNNGSLPPNFVIALPKVTTPSEIETLSSALSYIESTFHLNSGSIKIEFLAEESRAFVGVDGRYALPEIIAAAGGRCRGVHLGAYDLLSSFGVGSSDQTLSHQFCDHARNVMQFSTVGLGVWLSDGATNEMPIGTHRGPELTHEQVAVNQRQVRCAWRLHYANCQRAIEQGIYQGWDLHPAQVPARLVAEYAHIARNIEDVQRRFRSFTENLERSTLTGGVFDDAATGRGLEAFLRRAKMLDAL